MEIDKDGNYVFTGQIAIGGKMDNDYTLTISQASWQPIGVISGAPDEHHMLMERVDKLERLVGVLANALGVNEEFLSSVAEGV